MQNSLSVNSSAFSQGFTVFVNDFHGKIKETYSIDENGNEISRTKYEYYGINEKQKVISENGQISESILGRDIDIIIDKNRSKNESDIFYGASSLSVGLIPVPSIEHNVTTAKVLEILDWSHTEDGWMNFLTLRGGGQVLSGTSKRRAFGKRASLNETSEKMWPKKSATNI